MHKNTTKMLIRAALLGIAMLPIATFGSGSAFEPATGEDPAQADELSPEIAIELAKEEANVIAYIDSCVNTHDQKNYFRLLSDRYLDYLAQFGRVDRQDLEAARSAHSAPPPECGVNEAAVLGSFTERDEQIAPLIDSTSPKRPEIGADH